MQGYDPKIDAAELVRRHGPEKAQQIIAEFMRDRGMSDRNSEIWSGLDVRTAQRGMEPSDLSDGMAGAPQSTVGDDAGLDGQDGSGRDWGNWKPGMPLPTVGGGGMRSGDDSQRGRGYQKVPGPRTPDGKPTAQGDTMWNPEAIEQYTTRPLDPETGMYSPSPKDSDMQKRGMVPVFNDDGSVGYSVAYGTGLQGGPGRAGPRKDLEKAGWVQETVEGPTGPQQVYRPGDKAKAKYADYRRERQLFRQAEAAGMTPDELMKADPNWKGVGDARPGGATRRLVEAERSAGRDDRQSKWRAQMMLAGGNPRKNMVNAWSMMNDPDVSAQQRKSLQYMLPGGQLAAEVDARGNQQAFELARQYALGAGFQDPNSPAAQAAAAAMRDKQRRDNPESAGVSDLASGNHTSTEAMAEADRLAASMDQDWGGFSYQREMELAQRLQKPPYNMRQPDAEAAAHRAAEGRRWWWNQGGSPRGGGNAPGQPAPGAPTPPNGATPPQAPGPWTTGGV